MGHTSKKNKGELIANGGLSSELKHTVKRKKPGVRDVPVLKKANKNTISAPKDNSHYPFSYYDKAKKCVHLFRTKEKYELFIASLKDNE